MPPVAGPRAVVLAACRSAPSGRRGSALLAANQTASPRDLPTVHNAHHTVAEVLLPANTARLVIPPRSRNPRPLAATIPATHRRPSTPAAIAPLDPTAPVEQHKAATNAPPVNLLVLGFFASSGVCERTCDSSSMTETLISWRRPPVCGKLSTGLVSPAGVAANFSTTTGTTSFDVPAPVIEHQDLSFLIDLDDQQEWWDSTAVEKHHDMMSDRHRELVDRLISEGETHVGTIFRRKRDGKTRAEVRMDGIAGCLRTPKGGSAKQIVIVIAQGKLKMRWMSAREYARLQGAADFPLVANNIQNLLGFGDAVCVPVIRGIDSHILSPLFEHNSSAVRQCLITS